MEYIMKAKTLGQLLRAMSQAYPELVLEEPRKGKLPKGILSRRKKQVHEINEAMKLVRSSLDYGGFRFFTISKYTGQLQIAYYMNINAGQILSPFDYQLVRQEVNIFDCCNLETNYE